MDNTTKEMIVRIKAKFRPFVAPRGPNTDVEKLRRLAKALQEFEETATPLERVCLDVVTSLPALQEVEVVEPVVKFKAAVQEGDLEPGHVLLKNEKTEGFQVAFDAMFDSLCEVGTPQAHALMDRLAKEKRLHEVFGPLTCMYAIAEKTLADSGVPTPLDGACLNPPYSQNAWVAVSCFGFKMLCCSPEFLAALIEANPAAVSP